MQLLEIFLRFSAHACTEFSLRFLIFLHLQASAAVSINIFSTGSTNLLEQTKCIQSKKQQVMLQILGSLGNKLDQCQPITNDELQPFLDALNVWESIYIKHSVSLSALP